MYTEKDIVWIKTSLTAWFDKFSRAVIAFGYQQSNADHTIFVKYSNDKIVILILYPDDIVVTGNQLGEIFILKPIWLWYLR